MGFSLRVCAASAVILLFSFPLQQVQQELHHNVSIHMFLENRV